MEQKDIELLYRVMNNYESMIDLLEATNVIGENTLQYNRGILSDFKQFVTDSKRDVV